MGNIYKTVPRNAILKMDKGPILAPQVINSSIQSNTDDDEIEDFVLQLDEADINNEENFDDDLKDDDRLLCDDNATNSSTNDDKEKKESVAQDNSLKQDEHKNENELSNISRLNLAHKDSRFSNHDRLEDGILVPENNEIKNKSINSNNENSITTCDSKKSSFKDNSVVVNSEIHKKYICGDDEQAAQSEDEEAKAKAKERNHVEGKKQNVEQPSKQNSSNELECTNNEESSTELPVGSAVAIKEESNDEDFLLATAPGEETTDSCTEKELKSELPTIKQCDDEMESIDKELDSLLGSDASINEKIGKEGSNPVTEEIENSSARLNGTCDSGEESNASIVGDKTVPTNEISCTSGPSKNGLISVAVDKKTCNEIANSSSPINDVGEQNCKEESNHSSSLHEEMLIDDEERNNTMDFEDSLGNDTDISSIGDSSSKNSEGISQNKNKDVNKSNHDIEENNSGLSSLKGYKRVTDHVDEYEIRSKKSKLIDKEDEILQTKVLNGVGLKRKIEEIDNKKTNVEKESVKKKVDHGMNRVNGHVFNEVKAYVKNDKNFMVHRERLEKDYLNESSNYTIDRDAMDELIMLKVLEFVSYKSESGDYRQQGRFLESEQVRLSKQVNSLKKQIEDAKHIIKKLLEEKVTDQPWTQQAIPLKVTRSVGLQVCTCGTVNMSNSKSKDRESVKQLLSKSAEEAKKNTEAGGNHKVDNNKNNNDDLLIITESATESTGSKEQTVNNKKDSTNKIMELTKNLDAERNSRRSSDGELKTGPNESRPNINPEITKIKLNAVPPKTRPNCTPSKPALTISRKEISGEKSSILPNSNIRKEASSKTSDKSQRFPALIDLTDNEDTPVKSDGDSNQAKKSSSPSVSVKPPSALYPPEKLMNALSKDTIKNSQTPTPPKSWPPPIGPASRKTNSVTSSSSILPFVSSNQDLANSFEHLPKFPPTPKYHSTLSRPPRPNLRIGKNNSGKQGIMLSWSFDGGRNPSNIEEYQLYAYQENKSTDKNKVEAWKKVGDIKALPLPMACFLTQFVEGHKYHFIVRAVDKDKVLGDFSLPGSIILQSASAAATSTPPASTAPSAK